MQNQPTTTVPRIAVDEKELARSLNVSVHFLRKDRITKRMLPFYRIGGRVLYNLDRVNAALAGLEVGGAATPSKPRRA